MTTNEDKQIKDKLLAELRERSEKVKEMGGGRKVWKGREREVS